MLTYAVYRRLMEIESRLLPCGLHTVGVPPTAEESIATLVNIASIDRPEDGIESLPRIIARRSVAPCRMLTYAFVGAARGTRSTRSTATTTDVC